MLIDIITIIFTLAESVNLGYGSANSKLGMLMNSLGKTIVNQELEILVAERTQELAAALQQAQDRAERMEVAIEAAKMGTCDWNILTQKIIWNDRHVELLGYIPGAEYYSYADWECRVHPEDLPGVKAAIDLAIATQTDYSSEYRVIWADGSIHWINGFGRFYYDQGGQPIRMAGVASDITDRKQAELLIEISEEQYRTLIENIAQIVWQTDAGGQVVTEQLSWSKFTGQSYDEYSGWGWLNAIHPENRLYTEQLWSMSVANQTIFEVEYRLQRHDGEYRAMSVQGVPLFNQAGNIRQWIGIHTDITDRKQHEIALRRSEEFNRQILEHNNDCIKVLDLDGRLLYMNDSGQRLLEIDDFSQYVSKFWLQFWEESDRQYAELAIKTAKTGAIYRFEAQCLTAKGSIKSWDVVVSPMLDDQGNVDRILSVSHDITARCQAEAAIKESEQRFRATFEQAAVGVAHVGLDGQWLRVNQKLCAIVGYTEAELRPKTFQDITHPDDLAADLEYVRQILAGDIQTYVIEKRYIHKLGQIVWVNLTVSLRWDNSGTPIYFISVVEDISDRKQAEFALKEKTLKLAKFALIVKQRNQDLDQFAHIVSHDLKAPLRAISNLATWIEDDFEGEIPTETQEHLTLMRSRVTRMESLINGLLDYARIGNTPASLTTFKVEDLLAEIIDSLSISPSFTIDLPTNLPVITTNRMLLSQVLANLLGNAVKHHNRSDGRIQVMAQPQGKIWTFTVVDDGGGIAPENQERVFGVFQTLATRDSQENTGIGLSIVKKIVESQGGNITLVSELGHGTTFEFTWMIGN